MHLRHFRPRHRLLLLLPGLLLILTLAPPRPSSATPAAPDPVAASRGTTQSLAAVPMPATWLQPTVPAVPTSAAASAAQWQEVSSGMARDASPDLPVPRGQQVRATGLPDFVVHSVAQTSLPLVEPVVVTAKVTNQGASATFPSHCTTAGLKAGCLYAKIRFYFFLDPATGLPGDTTTHRWVCKQLVGTSFATGATYSLGTASFNPSADKDHPLIEAGGGLPDIGFYYADMTIDVPLSDCQ